ncbi:MAG: antitermination protein NusG [Planctomycetes bacterium DG_23]|nr:MAG: antitermination protein NusG [Planctomycetes bacterium DG_23]
MAKNWFVVRVQSGKETQAKKNLEKRIKMQGLQDRIGRVMVPSERVTEVRGGLRRTTERKIYPGYLMVEMQADESGRIPRESWFLVRETPGVGDFVGAGATPVALKEHEVERILSDAEKVKEEVPRLKIDFKVNDSVKIKEGPFQNFDGVVEEVNPTKGLIKVIVTIFSRATPVELEYWQVERI